MPLRVFRLVDCRHAHALLDGTVAARSGARWNPRGSPVVYTSLSPSLAILELMNQDPLATRLERQVLGIITVPAALVERLDPALLAPRWRSLGHHTQEIGARWLAHGNAALVVPSAIHDHEDNLLLNPRHPRFQEITLVGCEPLRLRACITLTDDGPTPPAPRPAVTIDR